MTQRGQSGWRGPVQRLLGTPQTGLVLVILALVAVLAATAGSHVDPRTGAIVNNFLNLNTLFQIATDTSFFAIMAAGATVVIISGGIDLSVGSIYAMAGVATAMALRALAPGSTVETVIVAVVVSLGVGLVCGVINGAMVVGLRVHPFIITLGTMWIVRGIAFVSSHAESILVPPALTGMAKATLGFGGAVYPMPLIVMLAVTALVGVYLTRTVMGRHVFAIGGNPEASRFSGLNLSRIKIGVFVISGLTAGLAALVGASFYGSASCADATGYELYVIASAVVGGASLSGGKGSATSAMLGALLIVLIRQSIRTLRFDQNYEWIIIGCATIVAVVLDQASARAAERRLAAAAAKR
jgi:ribose/xylose/arabinose/galactoside ABC-type transport system permease subunit